MVCSVRCLEYRLTQFVGCNNFESSATTCPVLQLTCVSPCAVVVIFAGLGVSELTDSNTHVPFELQGCKPTISDVYLPVGRMAIQG